MATAVSVALSVGSSAHAQHYTQVNLVANSSGVAPATDPNLELPGPLPDTLQNQEREIIETALAECKGRVAGPKGAAARLGIPRSTLDSKITQLKIKKRKFICE